MYGLPKDFEGTFLIERNLEQICLTGNTMSFHFDGDISITLENEYTCTASTDSSNPAPSHVPAFQPELVGLLEQTIKAATGSADGTLSLTFANGYRLALYDLAGYEAYHIRYGNRVITV